MTLARIITLKKENNKNDYYANFNKDFSQTVLTKSREEYSSKTLFHYCSSTQSFASLGKSDW
jgi:hypothetical protein